MGALLSFLLLGPVGVVLRVEEMGTPTISYSELSAPLKHNTNKG